MQFSIVQNELTDELSAPALKIYLVIREYFPKMFPSVKTICQKSGFCRNTVFKYLKELESYRVIKRIRRWFKSNVYEINPALLMGKQISRMKQAISQVLHSTKTRYAKYRTRVPNTGTLTRVNTYPNGKFEFSGIGSIINTVLPNKTP